MLQIKTARSGFTLVELLMVIALVGIFGTVTAVIAVGGNLQKARDGRRIADLESIRSALEIHRNELKYYPTTLAGLSAYMNTVPNDPSTGLAYSYGARRSTNAACDNSSAAAYCVKYELCTLLEGTTNVEINHSGTCWAAGSGTNTGPYNVKKTQL